jgi:1,4-dihydroxy-2-naphthoate octaprenyltransferase
MEVKLGTAPIDGSDLRGANFREQFRGREDGRGTIHSMLSPMASPSPASRPLAAWLLAVRPKTLPASVSPMLIGCVVAWREGRFAILPALAAFIVALLLQVGANLANDVADFRKGADTGARLGPVRVTQTGLIAPQRVVAATAVVLALAAVPGLYLVWLGGWPFAVIGLLAIASAVGYTAGPKPLGYLGLGELFVFLFFGPVAVAGTAYVMTHAVTPLSLAASIPMGFLIAAILVVNNLRDIDTDRVAGKRTIAVRIGPEASRREYATLIAASYLVPLMLAISGAGSPWLLLTWVTLPIALALTRRLWTASGRALNPVLAGTARLVLWYAIAFAVGLTL